MREAVTRSSSQSGSRNALSDDSPYPFVAAELSLSS